MMEGSKHFGGIESNQIEGRLFGFHEIPGCFLG